MAVTSEQRIKIIECLNLNKKQYEIARELGVTRSVVQHYAKQLKTMAMQKNSDEYFDVDLYFKSIPTI
jgi:predicted transcriptional regulator